MLCLKSSFRFQQRSRTRALDFKVEGPTFYTIGGGATMVGADEPKKFEKYAL